jgi:hypothetical protein
MDMTDNDYLATALRAMRAGVSVLPPRQDGSKRPVSAWKHYQAERADEETIRDWYANGRTGVGVVPGAVSSGLELFEFDEPFLAQSFIDAADVAGMRDLVLRIMAGYCELTPGGGVHWFWRCAEIGGNTKLARRPEPTDENPHGVKVLIETRGEGGFAIVAPSNGRVHPSGGAYERISGDWDSVTTITPDERRALFDLARTFDEMPPPAPVDHFDSTVRVGDRPGDRFAEENGWGDILRPHGWTYVFDRDGVMYWRRPGKDYGISATTNYGGSNLLYVFSSSTEFEPEQSYTKFGAYAVLNHGGDYRAAATALSAQQPGGVLVRHEPTIQEMAQAVEVDPETGEVKPRERRFEIIEAPDYLLRPPPRWLVPGLLLEQSVVAVYGPPASYKSFYVLDLLASLATGTRFHGMTTRQGSCLLVAAEGAGGLVKRLHAWQKARGVPLPRTLKILPGVVPLMDKTSVADLIADIRSFNEKFEVVALDTFSRSIAGADENKQAEMSIASENAQAIQQELGCVVILVHHGRKGDGSFRGSSVLTGALETIIQVTADESHIVRVHMEKQKDDEGPSDMFFRRIVVPLDLPRETIEEAGTDGQRGGILVSAQPTSVVLERLSDEEERVRRNESRQKPLTADQQQTLGRLILFGMTGATWAGWFAACQIDRPGLNRGTFQNQKNVLVGRLLASTTRGLDGTERFVAANNARQHITQPIGVDFESTEAGISG